MPATPTLDADWRLRLAAFARLRALRDRYPSGVPGAALAEGFDFEGERIRLFDPRRGIWRPRQLGRSGAALTIVTAAPKAGREPPYDDQIASDAERFIYRYEGVDPDLWTNEAVRRAAELSRPLIYLYGIAPGVYDPIFPCYVVDDHPGELAFELMADIELQKVALSPVDISRLEARRAYTTAAVKVRLHQHRFRLLVVSAYRHQCTVCRLRHPELLDAAHIIEDRDERGRPEVPNGLALCKIHHSAFDANILGISPDARIHIRGDVLEEHDGPMLLHGLQEMHGQRIHLPGRADLRPRREYLEERFARFRAA